MVEHLHAKSFKHVAQSEYCEWKVTPTGFTGTPVKVETVKHFSQFWSWIT